MTGAQSRPGSQLPSRGVVATTPVDGFKTGGYKAEISRTPMNNSRVGSSRHSGSSIPSLAPSRGSAHSHPWCASMNGTPVHTVPGTGLSTPMSVSLHSLEERAVDSDAALEEEMRQPTIKRRDSKVESHQWFENHQQTRPLVKGVRPQTKRWQRRRTTHQSGRYSKPQLVFPPVPRTRRCVTSFDDLANQDDLHHMMADMCRKIRREAEHEDHGRDAVRLLMLRQELGRLCDRRIGKLIGKNESAPGTLPPGFIDSGGALAASQSADVQRPEMNADRKLLSRRRKHRLECRTTFNALYDSGSVATLCNGATIPKIPRPRGLNKYGKCTEVPQEPEEDEESDGKLRSPVPCVQKKLEELQAERSRRRANATFTPVQTPVHALTVDSHTRYTEQCGTRMLLPLTGVLNQVSQKPNHVDLSKRRLGNRIMEVLAQELTGSPELQYLDLSHNGMSEKGCAAVVKALDNPQVHESIEVLKLSGNTLGNYVIEQISDFSRQSKRLHTLELNDANIGNYGAGWLLAQLSNSTSLTSLSLSGNAITERGAEEVANLISNTRALQTLDLSYNNIRRGAAVAVAKAIADNKTISSLNLSWNALGDEAAAHVAVSLEANSTITELNLASNQIRTAGAMSLAPMLCYNTTLQLLVLDDNPLESPGTRALLSVIMDPQLPDHKLSIKGCNLSVNPVQPLRLNFDRPAGSYSLNLSAPLDRAIAFHLHGLTKIFEGQNLSVVKLDAQNNWGGLNEATPRIKPLPQSGTLQVEFVETIPTELASRRLSDEKIPQLQSILKGVDHSARIRVLQVMAASFTFEVCQIQSILSVFDYGDNRIDALGIMFGQVLDQENVHIGCEELVGEPGMAKLEKRIGSLYECNRTIPCGHYKLGLDNEHHVVLLKQLATISQRLAIQHQEQRVFDVSQHGTFHCFRNESYQLDPIEIGRLNPLTWRGKEIDLGIVEKGLLEFDFVPDVHAPMDQEPMSEKNFDKWSKKARKLRREPKELRRWVRWEMMHQVLSVEQVGLLLEAVAQDDETRVDLIMICWTRIVDRQQNVHRLLPRIGPSAAVVLRKKIGWLRLFDPLDLDVKLELDFSLRDERLVAQYLLEVAMHEKGEELVLPCTLQAPGAEFPDELKNVPASWLEEMPTNLPTQGTWGVEYDSDIPFFDLEEMMANQEAKFEAQQELIASNPDAEIEEVEMDPQILEQQHNESHLKKLEKFRLQMAIKILGMKHLQAEN